LSRLRVRIAEDLQGFDEVWIVVRDALEEPDFEIKILFRGGFATW